MSVDHFQAERISDIARHWAQTTPDNVVVYEDERVVTFGTLWANVEAAQEYLQSQGVTPGDRVLIVAENCLAVVVLVFALVELGAWPAIVNARLSEREVEAIRTHSRPRLLLFTHAASPDALRHGIRYRATEISPAGLGPLMAGPVDPSSEREPEAVRREVAALIYTSGTTGQPKGVMVTHRGLLHFARVSAEARNIERDDCAYAVMPMSHIFGLGTLLLATLQAGASLYLSPRFSAADVCAALRREAISILQGVPTMFNRIVAHAHDYDESIASRRLRYLYAGGGPLDATLKRRVEALFDLPLHHGYGMTEYAGSLSITRIERPRGDGSCGEIVEGAELRIVGVDGSPVQEGETGELWVRGPGVMRGYYRASEMTAQVLDSDGWLNSGDLGRLGLDGSLFIVGRTRDLIVRSGFNVYPQEVESVINTYPSVRQSAVVGRSTVDGNGEVVAFVAMKDGELLDAPALHDYLCTRLAPYKRPEKIVRVLGIPMTASGKILKSQLRTMLSREDDEESAGNRIPELNRK
jgi:long-chain acyl-CoA synthetase